LHVGKRVFTFFLFFYRYCQLKLYSKRTGLCRLWGVLVKKRPSTEGNYVPPAYYATEKPPKE
jgi:hypothetical protein